MNLNLSASVGFIALFGVAVLNGVVMIAAVNRLREGGDPLRAGDPDAARARGSKPVLMTALVAALGFVPMAVSTGAGAEVQRPLATVVIGGVGTSTLLTLVVLPTLYELVEAWVGRRREESGGGGFNRGLTGRPGGAAASRAPSGPYDRNRFFSTYAPIIGLAAMRRLQYAIAYRHSSANGT